MNTNHKKIKTYLAGFLLAFVLFPFMFQKGGWCEEAKETHFKESVSYARLAVEHAWETYHHAALGGTLASPKIQSELEMNLHKSRALLAEAYKAEERGDMKTVRELIHQILEITDEVIKESQEPKK